MIMDFILTSQLSATVRDTIKFEGSEVMDIKCVFKFYYYLQPEASSDCGVY